MIILYLVVLIHIHFNLVHQRLILNDLEKHSCFVYFGNARPDVLRSELRVSMSDGRYRRASYKHLHHVFLHRIKRDTRLSLGSI